MDRAPTDAMDGLVKQIQEVVTARTSDMEKSQTARNNTVRNEMLFFIIAVTGISLFLAIIFISQIIKPINTLKNKLADIAENDGDLAQKIDINSKDETGELADYVNKFIYNLRTIMLEINKGASVVSETAQQLNSSSQQTTGIAMTTASNMSQVSASVDQSLLVFRIYLISLRIQLL
ncbi:HAMP domain-containing protein [Desulforamulus reducens]|uniref:HAMP domain-containing protein n=1 Tax=Desulforamulus reducens TaxID=59610 RepID=UPI00006B6989|nr:methyl-accepting chemotaxis protein [Desulforamulus reducens]